MKTPNKVNNVCTTNVCKISISKAYNKKKIHCSAMSFVYEDQKLKTISSLFVWKREHALPGYDISSLIETGCESW